MTQYIILRDTFGDGLETFVDIELDVVRSKEELPVYVNDAFDCMVSDDENGSEDVDVYDFNEIVICEILDEIDGVDTATWIKQQIIKTKKEANDEESNDEEYQQYLKLKEKFEK